VKKIVSGFYRDETGDSSHFHTGRLPATTASPVAAMNNFVAGIASLMPEIRYAIRSAMDHQESAKRLIRQQSEP
jgi:hypothetical protein